jgi:hypothetical protein
MSGDAPETWNFEHPERVKALHQGFVDAGADIILTNTFGGNARRLMLHGLQSRALEINRLAAQHARAVADALLAAVRILGVRSPDVYLLDESGPPLSLVFTTEPRILVGKLAVKKEVTDAEREQGYMTRSMTPVNAVKRRGRPPKARSEDTATEVE